MYIDKIRRIWDKAVYKYMTHVFFNKYMYVLSRISVFHSDEQTYVEFLACWKRTFRLVKLGNNFLSVWRCWFSDKNFKTRICVWNH